MKKRFSLVSLAISSIPFIFFFFFFFYNLRVHLKFLPLAWNRSSPELCELNPLFHVYQLFKK